MKSICRLDQGCIKGLWISRKGTLFHAFHGFGHVNHSLANLTPKPASTKQAAPAFSEALRQAQTQALDGFMLELMSMTTQAAQAIRDGLDNPDIDVKLKAASLFSSRLLQFKQLHDLENRLAALENK